MLDGETPYWMRKSLHRKIPYEMISKEIPISDEKHLDPGKSVLDVNWLRSILMDLELAYYAL